MAPSINVSTNSATIQNNIRLRIVLVILLSICIQSARFIVSDSVQRAISLTEINYILYGLFLLSSIMPSKAAWYLAAIIITLVTLLDTFILTLGIVSTLRCLNKSGCLTTIPGSLIVLSMVTLQCAIDLYQVWNVYLVIRLPLFVASSTQRMRILYAWAIPFAIVSNITLFSNSEWTVLASPPLVAYPMLIFLAHSGENTFLIILSLVALISNVLLIIPSKNRLLNLSSIIQTVMCVIGICLLCVPVQSYKAPPIKKDTENETILPVAVAKETDIKLSTNKGLRRRTTIEF